MGYYLDDKFNDKSSHLKDGFERSLIETVLSGSQHFTVIYITFRENIEKIENVLFKVLPKLDFPPFMKLTVALRVILLPR